MVGPGLEKRVYRGGGFKKEGNQCEKRKVGEDVL
jgi:hypothetical protein